METTSATNGRVTPRNKGKLLGQKPGLVLVSVNDLDPAVERGRVAQRHPARAQSCTDQRPDGHWDRICGQPCSAHSQ